MSLHLPIHEYARVHRIAHYLGRSLQQWAAESHAKAQAARIRHLHRELARRELLRQQHREVNDRRDRHIAGYLQQPRGF